MNLAQHTGVFLIRVYRWTLSPMKTALLGPSARCRFSPSCSAYALEAIRQHGFIKGSYLAIRRLCRCHPWGSQGYDPVPPPNGAPQPYPAAECPHQSHLQEGEPNRLNHCSPPIS